MTLRECKYRGKSKETGEWIYGFYGKLEDLSETKHYIMTQTVSFNPRKSLYFTDHEVYPKTVGQFIGLYDKKSKEIYDDDLAKLINPYTEKPTNGLARVVFSYDYPGGWGLKADNYFTIISNKTHLIEIIGNAHDNPELVS